MQGHWGMVPYSKAQDTESYRVSNKNLRQIMLPTISTKSISTLEPIFQSCIRDLIHKLDETIKNKQSEGGATIDLVTSIQYTILDIIGATSFGGSFNFVKTGNYFVLAKIINERYRQFLLWLVPILKFVLPQDEFMRKFTSGIINRRREETLPKRDILQNFLESGRENGVSLTDQDIHAHIMDFLVNIEPTSYTLWMAMIYLVKFPDKLHRLFQELCDAIPSIDLDNLPSQDQLKNLPYLNAVLNEILRLWPVMLEGSTAKEAVDNIDIQGYIIPKGTAIIPNYFALHRSRDEWGNDVNEFRPERWLEPEKLPQDAFYPFSAGLTICPGKNFAWVQMRLLLATLVRRYKFADIPEQNFDIVQDSWPRLSSGKYLAKISFRE